MGKLKSKLSEKYTSKSIMDSAHQIWLAGLGAFAKTQEEGMQIFETLVKEGTKLEQRTRQAAEDTVGQVRKTAEAGVDSVKTQATGNWDKLEQVFEERVARALHALNVPVRGDIDALGRRVDALSEALDALRAAGAPVRKTAARKTPAAKAPARKKARRGAPTSA